MVRPLGVGRLLFSTDSTTLSESYRCCPYKTALTWYQCHRFWEPVPNASSDYFAPADFVPVVLLCRGILQKITGFSGTKIVLLNTLYSQREHKMCNSKSGTVSELAKPFRYIALETPIFGNFAPHSPLTGGQTRPDGQCVACAAALAVGSHHVCN